MSSVGYLREFINERLTVAAEEIFGVFEKTIVEYEEEIQRQRRLLDVVWKPEKNLQRIDVQQKLVVKEVTTKQQEWSSSLDQEDQEPPHIKEEQEELWISQEAEQCQGLEEADIAMFPFTTVPLKSVDEDEIHQFSQRGAGAEPAMNSVLDTHFQSHNDDKTGEPSEPREPQSGLNSLTNDKVPVSDLRCSDEAKKSGKRFGTSGRLKKHTRSPTVEKPFICSVCKKAFKQKGHFQEHVKTHTGEKPFSCPFCKKAFTQSGSLKKHIRIHTGEKPFSCSVCKKAFAVSGNLKKHMRIHTGEKPFSCSICKKAFTESGTLHKHMRIHTGEKPFSCSVCKKAFTGRGNLQSHMRIHTGEKLWHGKWSSSP
ncbi:gastrula zinc finger protein XlCGF57.1-like isoform X2 [Etheostoma cragini]|uniref:gastrula zinc finger protein XlCGF57.1-like isoform X2 n=1 Tax=Etheostoma cragini TaxID=417921 RepID=UPI00155E74F0|nr:gastrula zinc finger protein XlCGF57.1-like isoform X2 [Etheostoma cragini]